MNSYVKKLGEKIDYDGQYSKPRVMIITRTWCWKETPFRWAHQIEKKSSNTVHLRLVVC